MVAFSMFSGGGILERACVGLVAYQRGHAPHFHYCFIPVVKGFYMYVAFHHTGRKNVKMPSYIFLFGEVDFAPINDFSQIKSPSMRMSVLIFSIYVVFTSSILPPRTRNHYMGRTGKPSRSLPVWHTIGL